MVNNRERGKRGERSARDAVRKYLHAPDCTRAAQHNGTESADLKGALLGAHVEVKLRKAIGAIPFWEQAEADRAPGEFPVVLMKQDGRRVKARDPQVSGWFVMVAIEDVESLVQAFRLNKMGSR